MAEIDFSKLSNEQLQALAQSNGVQGQAQATNSPYSGMSDADLTKLAQANGLDTKSTDNSLEGRVKQFLTSLGVSVPSTDNPHINSLIESTKGTIAGLLGTPGDTEHFILLDPLKQLGLVNQEQQSFFPNTKKVEDTLFSPPQNDQEQNARDVGHITAGIATAVPGAVALAKAAPEAISAVGRKLDILLPGGKERALARLDSAAMQQTAKGVADPIKSILEARLLALEKLRSDQVDVLTKDAFKDKDTLNMPVLKDIRQLITDTLVNKGPDLSVEEKNLLTTLANRVSPPSQTDAIVSALKNKGQLLQPEEKQLLNILSSKDAQPNAPQLLIDHLVNKAKLTPKEQALLNTTQKYLDNADLRESSLTAIDKDARRWLGKVANGKIDGFQAINKTFAIDLKNQITDIMKNNVPGFDKFLSQYQALSEPLDAFREAKVAKTALKEGQFSDEGGTPASTIINSVFRDDSSFKQFSKLADDPLLVQDTAKKYFAREIASRMMANPQADKFADSLNRFLVRKKDVLGQPELQELNKNLQEMVSLLKLRGAERMTVKFAAYASAATFILNGMQQDHPVFLLNLFRHVAPF